MAANGKKVTFQRLLPTPNGPTLGIPTDHEYKVKALQALTKIKVGPRPKERILKVGDTLTQQELDAFCESKLATVIVQSA